MKKYLPAVSLLIILLTAHLKADETDCGLWANFGLEADLSKKWELETGLEYRMKDNISQTDQIRGAFETSYKIWKYIKLGAGYEYIADKKKKGYFSSRNRFNLQAIASYKYSRFIASWRPRIQMTLLADSELDDADMSNGEWIFRNRFGLEYDIKDLPLKPYIQFEMFSRIFDDIDRQSYYKNRITAGLKYTIAKQHSIDLAYKRETESENSVYYYSNIVAIGYKYNFSLYEKPKKKSL